MAQPATYPQHVIAKLLGLTERHVRRLTTDGVIPAAARGRYELVPAVQGYIKYLRERAIGGDVSGDAGTEHKTRLLKARADIAETEAERLSGELISAAAAEKVWSDITARFRARVLAIAHKAAPMVAIQTETDACYDIIETYIHEALAELAATPVVSAGDDGAAAADAAGANDAEDDLAAAETDDLGVGGPVSQALE